MSGWKQINIRELTPESHQYRPWRKLWRRKEVGSRNLIGRSRSLSELHPWDSYLWVYVASHRLVTNKLKFSVLQGLQLIIYKNILCLRIPNHVHDLLVLHNWSKNSNAIRPQLLGIRTIVNCAVEDVFCIIVMTTVILVVNITSPYDGAVAEIRYFQQTIK